MSKIIVFTATGDQGGSVCKYLMEDGGFEVVGITRNPEATRRKVEWHRLRLIPSRTDPIVFA